MKNTTIQNCSDTAVTVSGDTVDLDPLWAGGNKATGCTNWNGIRFNNLTLAKDATVHTNDDWDIAFANISVPDGKTLTVPAGQWLKFVANGLSIQNGGTLKATGTADQPVTFTSWRDDTIGGDTNNDSDSTKPTRGEWYGIYAEPGSTVTLDHALVRYSQQGVNTNGAATTSLKNTTIQNCSDTAVTVSGDTVDLDPLWAGGNKATGCTNWNGIRFNNLTLAKDATVHTNDDWDIAFANISVPDGKTLTVPAGQWLKFVANGLSIQNGGTLKATGTADQPVTFTSWRDDTIGGDTNNDSDSTKPTRGEWYGIYAEPGSTVTLDGVDIRYASTAMSAASGSYAEIHGSVGLSAFGVAGSDDFLDATEVDWGDPSGPFPIGFGVGYSGDGVLVAQWKGWVAPPPSQTVGYTPTPGNQCMDIAFIGARGSGEGTQNEFDQAFANPITGITPEHYGDYLGARVAKVLDGMYLELGLGGGGPGPSVKALGVPYRALGVLSNPFRMVQDSDYLDSITDGVKKTKEMVQDEYIACHGQGQKMVLSGYSQGALVIHLALRELYNETPYVLNDIVGVALVSDPAKTAAGGEILLEAYDEARTDNTWAGSGIENAEGIWTKYPMAGDSGDLPTPVVGKTISMCRNHDPVCAPPSRGWFLTVPTGGMTTGRILIDMHIHTDEYYKANTIVLGRWVADRYLGKVFQLNSLA